MFAKGTRVEVIGISPHKSPMRGTITEAGLEVSEVKWDDGLGLGYIGNQRISEVAGYKPVTPNVSRPLGLTDWYK